MKDQVSVYVAIAVLIFAGFRIYQKYFNKDAAKGKDETQKKGVIPGIKDDDYEPYSKK